MTTTTKTSKHTAWPHYLAGSPELGSQRAKFIPGFEVMNLKTHASHGIYETLEQAKGCVAYDRLTSWQIWRNSSTLVAESDLS